MKINFNKYFGAKLICGGEKDMWSVKIKGDPFKDKVITWPAGRLPVKTGGTGPAVPGTGTAAEGDTGKKDGDACPAGGSKDGNQTSTEPKAKGE